MARAVAAAERDGHRLPGEVVLRIPPLHARPAAHRSRTTRRSRSNCSPREANVPVNQDLRLLRPGRSSGDIGSPRSRTQDRNLGTQSNKKVDIYLQLKNTEKNGMGIPLPAGRRARLQEGRSATRRYEFIGEDVIQHTPKDEEVLVKLGSAFDIVGERKQTRLHVN